MRLSRVDFALTLTSTVAVALLQIPILRATMDSCRPTVFISHLPSELLVQIFAMGLPSVNAINRIVQIFPKLRLSLTLHMRKERAFEAARCYALVCKAWFSVWMSTPTLWSTIVVDLMASSLKYPATKMEFSL